MKGKRKMTYKEFAIRLLKKNGIEFETVDERGEGCFKGVRNNIEWHINDTCSWDGCYQLICGEYKANRISIKTAIKKIMAL